ncbi:hypothetical protein P4O66_014187, partial [Electrophorus voltai]
SACYDSEAMASEPLEGFHEVNLASPTTPDLHGIAEPRPAKPAAPPSSLYRTHSLTSTPCPPNALYADQLPTQPVYPAPRHLANEDPHNGSVPGLEAVSSGAASHEAGSVEDGAPLGDEGEDPLALSTDSLSRLRSPSVMEVREKGYERLREELAKAQRVRPWTSSSSTPLHLLYSSTPLLLFLYSSTPPLLLLLIYASSPPPTPPHLLSSSYSSTPPLLFLYSCTPPLLLFSSYSSTPPPLLSSSTADHHICSFSCTCVCLYVHSSQELKLKDEECERLSKVRDQLGQELEELTASLFECSEVASLAYGAAIRGSDGTLYPQEAHKMVREANLKQATAEKQLQEALGKIDVMQAEVVALKTLVLSTSPTSPCKELPSGSKAPFRKGHTRNKSTSSAVMGSHQQELGAQHTIGHDSREARFPSPPPLPPNTQQPLCDWPLTPISSSCFVLGSAILEAVEQNTLSVEPVGFQPLPVVKASALECGGPKKCALSGQTKSCKHRIKLGDSSSYYYVSPFCRYRITSVCNFFTYIRYIHQGLVKQQDAEQMFWEVTQLRKEMSLAKLGYYRDEL